MRLFLTVALALLLAAPAHAQTIIMGGGGGGGGGTGTVTNTGALTSGQLIIGNTGVDIKVGNLSGDVTTSGSAVTTLASSGVSAGSCGDTTHSCSITVDIKGRVTALSNNVIAGGGGSGTVTSSGTPLIHQLSIFTTATDIKGLAVGATTGMFLRNVAASDPAWSTLVLPNAGVLYDVPLVTATNTWGYDTTKFTYSVSTGTLTAPILASGGASSGTLTLTNVGGAGFSYIEQVGNPSANLTFIPPVTGPSGTQCRNATMSGSTITEAYGACSGSGGDFSSNTSTSVDSEFVLFSGTGGKTGKRATGTGLALSTSGVFSVLAPTDDNMVIGNGTTWELKPIPNCTDTGGNHLNYTAASNALSCGTSGGSGGTNLANSSAYAAIANTASETYFAIGTDGKIPSGTLNTAGARLKIDLAGVYGSTTTDGVLVKIKFCTVSGCGSGTVTTLAATGTVTPALSETNAGWVGRLTVNTFTTGSSGTVDAQGYIAFATAATTAVIAEMQNTTTSTVDLTVDQYISVSVTWSGVGTPSATDTITLRNFGASVGGGGGGGSISGLTTNTIPKATSASTIGDSRLSDDGTTMTVTGSGLTVFTFTNGTAPSSPASGKDALYVDGTDLRFHDKNASGVVGTTVVADAGSSNNFLTAVSVAGAISKAQPAFTNLSGSAVCGQLPALTGDVTTSAGACATTLANIPTATPAVGTILHTNIAAPSSPASGKVSVYSDSTDLRLHDKNANGTIGTTVVADTGASNNFLTAVSAAGVISKAQPAFTNLSGAATTAQLPASITTATCNILVGANDGSALVDANLGPQFRQCFIPYAATIVEVTVASDAGTPSVQIRKNVAGTTTNLLSAALAAVGGNGASTIACARATTSATCYDGTTSSGSITVSTTSLAAGSWIELTSGTASSAKQMSIAVTYTRN